MPSAVFWEETPEAWDTLWLGGRAVPGIAKITGNASRKIDSRSPPNGDGARLRDRGYEPARIEVEIRVWTAEQLAALETLLEEIHPRRVPPATQQRSSSAARERDRLAALVGENPNAADQESVRTRLADAERRAEAERAAAAQPAPRGQRTPYDVVHPSLALLGVRRAYVTAASLPEVRGGELVTRISLLEWTATPTPAPRPATSSTGGGIEGIQTAFDTDRAARRPTPDVPARLR